MISKINVTAADVEDMIAESVDNTITVTDNAALAAVPATERSDGRIAVTESTGFVWRFDAESSEAGSSTCVVPTVGTGRWLAVDSTEIGAVLTIANAAQTDIDTHEANVSNPHSTTAAQVGADPVGTASAAVAAHVAASDPHPNYALESALGGAASLNVGTTAGTVAAGDDARLSDSRAPTTHGSNHRVGGSDAEFTHVVDPSEPYAVATNVRRITTSASRTIQLPDSGVNVGEVITVINSSASSITITGDPQGTDQLDEAGANVAITVSAHGACGFLRRAAGDWRSVQLGSTSLAGPRSIYISVVDGVLGWKEQVLVGNTWQDVSSFAAVSVDQNGGVTFSGTTYTIPVILAATTTPWTADDKRYVAFSSCSAELQAMVAAGSIYTMSLAYDSIENIANARIGLVMARTSGTSMDASSEVDVAGRVGWTGTAYQPQNSSGSGSWTSSPSSNAASLLLKLYRFIGAAGGSGWMLHKTAAGAWGVATPAGGLGGASPDRIYIIASAQTAGAIATCAIGNPRLRLVFQAESLS